MSSSFSMTHSSQLFMHDSQVQVSSSTYLVRGQIGIHCLSFLAAMSSLKSGKQT